MASTYTTGFGIEKIGTGEQDGTWGTTTNHNLDIIDRIASYKAVAITTNANAHTLTVREASPGSGTENLQDGMYRVIKFTGALDSDCTVTIAPNTAPAWFIIENATTDSGSSGPYNLILTQGSGANVTVQNGKNVIVYCDGAGSGAAVVDAIADLQVGTLEVTGAAAIDGAATLGSTLAVTGALTGSSTIQGTTITATTAFVPDASDGAALGTTSLEFSDLYLADGAVIGFGDDQDVTLTHVADTGLLLNSTMALQFNDASQYINAPSATVLDINATDEIELNATLADVNANLDVSGTLTQAGASQFNSTLTVGVDDTGYDVKFFGDTASAYMLWDASTDDLILGGAATLGIGTAAPDSNHKLEVYGTGTTEVAVRSGNSSEAIINFGDVDSRLRGRIAYNNSSEYLAFWANAGEKVRIGSDGMLMLGGSTSSYDTEPPVAGLSLYYETDLGAATIGTYSGGGATRLGFSTNTGGGANAERLRIEGAGSVWTPTVSGANNNLRLGYLAGEDIESGSNYNTLIGDSAGKEINTGDGNTTVGFQAGDALTTGGYNVAVGYDALSTCATAADNVAVGASALAACTVAGQTAVGNGAGQYHQTGVNFTALGFRALQNSTTGANNTAVGSAAMDATNTGGYNVAVGANAFGTNTTGSTTVAIGNDALHNSTTSSANTAVGNSSARSNTTGTENVAVGHSALYANVTGNYNTVMGAYALDAANPDSTTTTMMNVAIGAYAGSAATTGYENVFVGGQCANQGVVTGYYNTCVGQTAASNMTSATNNVLIGKLSGYTLTSASSNTYVGASSGFSATTGGNNVAIGQSAAYYMTDGHNNVIIGNSAGVGSSSQRITSAGHCIIIGDTAYASSQTADYQVVIGTSGTVGKGANTAFLNANSGAAYQGDNNASWTTDSDRRIKKNISDNNVGLDVINQIRVRNYEYRKPEEITDLPSHLAVEKEGVQLGVVAQEIREVLPNVVKEEGTGCLSVSNDDVTWHLVNAVKELSAKVRELEEKLNG